ncbi:SEC-C domain-containing protein [Chitinophaga ginsengisoli]|uniref:SEC-C motif-containing protein n=1 Tax=Chitinophaga ginsengisoli TaxID=363837 RepID=A0A2P8G4Y0_9BACT|nr:SEC-C domain-containing protein [Chitinophaga ginsengisoli]PSL29024.1 hypothetical protein CLV42_107170 [Chitinophaga ginsengisoli]
MISPIEITGPVQRLIDKIGSEYEHEIVPIKPDPAATPGNCYFNVQDKVAKDGGNLVYGWAVWLSDFICEGEHHAVWEDEDGNLVDVTPPRVPIDKLLFIPDDRFAYEGKHIGSIRSSIVDNPLVDHIILLAEMKDYLLRFATRVGNEQHHFNTFNGNIYTHYDTLFNNAVLFFREGGKLGSPCYCGSLKPYSQCHGKNLPASIEKVKDTVVKMDDLAKEGKEGEQSQEG